MTVSHDHPDDEAACAGCLALIADLRERLEAAGEQLDQGLNDARAESAARLMTINELKSQVAAVTEERDRALAQSDKAEARAERPEAELLMACDAPTFQCSGCGRKSVALKAGAPCGMSQPDGSRCGGTFRPVGTLHHFPETP